MLSSLRVRDLATVDDVTLELGPGLNILTGETGAGKSILIDALSLLLGERATSEAIRPGAERLAVDAEFTELAASIAPLLDELGIEAEESLVVRREVSSSGRSRAWVNGSPVTVGTLARLGENLVDLHGQHQTMSLTRSIRQRELLDRYADASELLARVASRHAEMQKCHRKVAELLSRRDEVQKRSDWLRHVSEEIDAAQLRIGEEEEINSEARRLAQVGVLASLAGESTELLDGDASGARAVLARLEKTIGSLQRLDPDTDKWTELLDNAWGGLDELSRRIAEYSNSLAEDPDRLDELEQRRRTIIELKRKHGGEVESVLAVSSEAKAELELLDTVEEDLGELQRQAATADEAYEASTQELTLVRQRARRKLAGEVSRLLPRLSLKNSTFEVELIEEDRPGAHGAESVRFVASLNPGMPARSIAESASGGELSRLMLALKVVLARHDESPTLVFDEIDQGIGGEAGAEVGRALGEVADTHQVLVLTHLPQVAARGRRHLMVSKGTRSGVATSDVTVLHGEDRMLEVARMLGGTDDPDARRLAQSMLTR